jgi:bifunctional DNase/RNase
MFKMYLEDITWDGEEAPCVLVFSNAKDDGRMSVEIPETIGFDLRTLLNQKLDGLVPYFGICELVKQIGGNIKKLMIRSSHRPGSASMFLEISGKTTEVELFFADIISLAIVLGLPIYFDDAICMKREMPLAGRLLWMRTESMTNYSFDTGN